MNRVVVTVDGVDGSGKSTFARRLVEEGFAGGVAVLARVDDFRTVVSWTEDEAATYYERYFALDAVGEVVRQFLGGAAWLTLPGFDGLAGAALPPREVRVPADAVLVIEGVFIRRIPLPPSPVTHIYLDVPEELASARLVARDTARGRARAEVEHRLRTRYVPGQRRYHAEQSPRTRADLVLGNTDPAHPQLLRCRPARLSARLHAALDRLAPGLLP